MLTENDIKEYELEITANCNAACPLCKRTHMDMPLRGNNELSLDFIKSIFSRKEQIQGKRFKLCGTIGDPIVHPECYEICEYLDAMGASKVGLSTNGGYNTPEWWERLARLKSVRVDFAIDGAEKTNHIYRINVQWNVLERNIRAYASAGGKGAWVFIPFDHNDSEYETARSMADEFGLNFKKRTSGRNELNKKMIEIKNKKKGVQKENKQIMLKNSTQNPHNDVSQIIKIVDAQKAGNQEKLARVTDEAIPTMKCKHLNTPEAFIGADGTLWPCCFLYDDNLKKPSPFLRSMSPGWNSLQHSTIDEILNSEPYNELTEAWRASHDYHLPRCIRTCAQDGAYLNKIDIISPKTGQPEK